MSHASAGYRGEVGAGELMPVFGAILENATRLCEGKFGILFMADAGGFRPAALHNVSTAHAEFLRREAIHRVN